MVMESKGKMQKIDQFGHRIGVKIDLYKNWSNKKLKKAIGAFWFFLGGGTHKYIYVYVQQMYF